MVRNSHGSSLSLNELFEQHHPQEAIVMGRNLLRYGDWAMHVALTIDELQEAGFVEGQRIAIYLPNSFEYVNLLLACWTLKIQTVLIPHIFPTDLVLKILKDYEIDHLIVERPLTLEYPGIPVAQFSKSFRKRTKAYEQQKDLFDWNISLDQEVAIIFSSGTTGVPKGIIHSFKNLYYSALGTIEHYHIQKGDSWVLSLPLYHVGGLMIIMRMLFAGGKIIFPLPNQTLAGLLLVYEPTFLSLVSTQLIRLFSKESCLDRLRKLKAVILGGGPAPEWPLKFAAENQIPVSFSYGSTEMCSQISGTIPFASHSHHFSTGAILPHRHVRIGPTGQIFVKGECLFTAYTHGTDRIVPFDSEGWFATQDRGHLDSFGHLHIEGRLDQVFKSGGENVRPDLIEDALKKLPWISDAVVVPMPHPEFGLVPMAFVEMVKKMPLKKILLYLKGQLPPYMIPKKIIFLDEENPYKGIKYNRHLLAERALNRPPHISR